ncbi:MAG: hypothetical protein N2D54_12875, partial [Chloroflexota bacterium]
MNKKPKDPNAPKLLEVLRNDLIIAVNWIFSSTEESGRNRRWLLIVILGSIWAWGAFQAYPRSPETAYVVYLFEALFSATVFRHVLVLGIVFWLSLQFSAQYLGDVFELNDIEIAERYILQSALANRYEKLEFKEGKVVGSSSSTILKIGGPGLVKAHMDSAALFESYDGVPTVVSPNDGLIALDRFERLRKIVSLRDHVDEGTIEARTKDGITVKAIGVRMKYHVDRGGTEPTLNIPYPFLREAITTLVYRENVRKFFDGVREKGTSRSATSTSYSEVLKLNANAFKSKLKKFISTATLGEFLATIGDREISQQQEDTDTLIVEAKNLTGEHKADQNGTHGIIGLDSFPNDKEDLPEINTGDTEKFYTRDKITNLIYEGNNEEDKIKSGLELDWIDIGTWELPENA